MNSIILADTDNVVVACQPVAINEVLAGGTVAREAIPQGHKVAIAPIKTGHVVVKYGKVIGRATQDIALGTHVHSHNLSFEDDRLSAGGHADPVEPTEHDKQRTFMGYRRADGRAGTRNFIGIIASVNCSTTLYRSMPEDMDVDCGPIVTGGMTIQESGRAIFELIIDTAWGRKSKSEEFGYGDNEFVPWHLGATL